MSEASGCEVSAREVRTWRDRIMALALGEVEPYAAPPEVMEAARLAYWRLLGNMDVDYFLEVILDIGYCHTMEIVQRDCPENNQLDRVLTRGFVAAAALGGKIADGR